MLPSDPTSAHSSDPRRDARRNRGDRWIIVGLFVVLVVVVAAQMLLWQHDNAPGAQGLAPARWPTASRIARTPGRPTLVMFVHPRCPCTRAALAELRTAMSALEGRVVARVLVARPDGVDASWTRGDLWDSAASIPGVEVAEDPGEREASLFAAATSGQVVLYGVDGALLFQGGITGGRGHVGDNDGRLGLVARVDAAAPQVARAPVFGCGLFAEVAP